MSLPAGDMITIDAMYPATWSSYNIYHAYYPKLEFSEWLDNYYGGMVLMLQQIRATKTGQALTKAITKPIRIIPYKRPSELNANASPMDPSKAYHKGLVFEAGRMATGEGSGSIIQFTPGMYTPKNPFYLAPPKNELAAQEPDSVLFHELVHAVRIGHGVFADRESSNDLNVTMEDFHAVMVTNIYCSELKRHLRRNHLGHLEMDTDSSLFYRNNASKVESFCKGLPSLAKQIAKVDCQFNPIREYFLHERLKK